LRQGNLFIISAPSGAGKTTILKEIIGEVPGLVFSVSHTTRSIRTGESHGRDYFFVDRQTFSAMRAENAFLEWAEVHGNLYGTSKAVVEAKLAEGSDILLDIDVQGARQIKESGITNAIFIFIAPPSWEILETRLTARGTDGVDIVRTRLANARAEMKEAGGYDYLIINDRLSEAVTMLKAIILAERCRKRRTAAGEALDLSSFGA
jgi:guanylate kinase